MKASRVDVGTKDENLPNSRNLRICPPKVKTTSKSTQPCHALYKVPSQDSY